MSLLTVEHLHKVHQHSKSLARQLREASNPTFSDHKTGGVVTNLQPLAEAWQNPQQKKYIGSFSSWRALTMTMTFWGGMKPYCWLAIFPDVERRVFHQLVNPTDVSNVGFLAHPCWIMGFSWRSSATPSIGNKALKKPPSYGIVVLKNLIGIAQARNPSQKERAEIPTIHFQVWAVSFGKK